MANDRHHHHHHHHYHRDVGPGDRPSPNPHQLRKSREHRVVCGVCGGLAEYFGWSPWGVRVVAILTMIFFPPLPFIAYLVACVVMKRAPLVATVPGRTPEEERFWRSVSTRPGATFSQLRHTFRRLEGRVADMERVVTAEEYRLNRAFREIEDRPDPGGTR